MTYMYTLTGPDVNPATGLPVIEGSLFDVGGNPYGTDLNTWQPTYDPSPSYTPLPSPFDAW